jgi:hypothetical protein
MLKKLFRGAFNLKRVVRIEYARAYTERQAWALMCRRMAEKDGVHPSVVMGLFDGSQDNFKIEREK